MRSVWSIALLSLALVACSQIQHHGSSGYAPVVTLGYGAVYWLDELHSTRLMAPGEVKLTVAKWEQALLDDPGDGNRIRLALLLIAGDLSVRDPKRARELLDELTAAPAGTNDRELVFIMRQILEQQEQQEQASAEIDKLNTQARQRNRRIRELEQQQRALTDIEQNIQQRTVQPDTDNDGE